ncbi:MAG TPA: ATP-binding protein [Actinomycetota bacterium]|nr:ATP-binding protein [Actinomycetota bacterium]
MSSSTIVVCERPEEIALSSVFQAAGHTVERATDGYRMIELAQRSSPQAIFVQLGVNGPLGPELIRRVRMISTRIRMVCILEQESGLVSAADLLRAGADGVLSATAEPDEMERSLDGVLAGGCVLSPGVARELLETFVQAAVREREWARSLAESAAQGEELASTKAEFLSNVSHELRTPLTIIKGVAQVVGKFGGASEDQAAMLGKLEAAATNLTRMVENLLTLAEMERGEFQLNVESCDIVALVREATQDTSVRYPKVNLDVRLPVSIPARADAERIREVIRQIVDNGCRYSEQGSTVSVQAKRAVEGIVVSVNDQGKGVDRRVVAAAFGQAFSPGESVLTKERAGLGMGLNLARNLVALHGGILSAEPLPGGGSKVSFVIPPEPQEKPVATPAPQQRQGEQDPGPPAETGRDEAEEPSQREIAIDADEGDTMEQLRELQRRLAQLESRANQS